MKVASVVMRRLTGPGSVCLVAATLVLAAGCTSPEGLDQSGVTGTAGTGVMSPPPPPPIDAGMIVGGRGGVAGTSACGSGVGAGGRASRGSNMPVIGTTIAQPVAPPAVSGGTMRVLADGTTVVAADPDRDQVYVVDLTSRTVRATVKLSAGDEPGRVVEDAAGRVHVALRHGGAVVAIDPATGTVLSRRAVCAAPRGLAHDPAVGMLHVACAGGELVSLPVAGGDPVRTLKLDRDLRDVVVDGPRLRVSRFKSAEILSVGADGAISERVALPAFTSPTTRQGQMFTPGLAYQMVAAPDGGVVMLHQRGASGSISTSMGGYGDPNPCNSVVHPAVSVVTPAGEVKTGAALAGLVLATDVAIAPAGDRIAVVAAGNAHNLTPIGLPASTRVFVSDLDQVTNAGYACPTQGAGNPGACSTPVPTRTPDGGADADGGAPTTAVGLCNNPDVSVPQVVGEPIAVAFAGDRMVLVQSREPAMLALGDGTSITLSSDSRADTGHLVFHANAGAGVACASCHAEGNDDGRVWNFDCSGARRTQSLQTGIRGTEPFHWSGDELDFGRLMSDVFVKRMSGPSLPADQMDGLIRWIDLQPRPAASPVRDQTAMERGHALFDDSKRAACASCHNGARFSNNTTVDVGTGAPFQVPSLVGIGTRGPFMHDGCAATLSDRFSATCGGAAHGGTADLTPTEISHLVAYLESL